MELIGWYHVGAYTVETYLLESPDPNAFSIWVLKEGEVIAEFTERMQLESSCDLDTTAIMQLEAAAYAALAEVARREAYLPDFTNTVPSLCAKFPLRDQPHHSNDRIAADRCCREPVANTKIRRASRSSSA